MIHFFTIGQFDIVIALHQSAYTEPLPVIKDVNWIVNFDMPESYKYYREAAQQIGSESGAIINLQTPEQEKKEQNLLQI